jgi:hypothetical protein
VPKPIPFRPDWVIAPACTLEEWMEDNGLSVGALAVACYGQANKAATMQLIQEVLDRKPLTLEHARALQRGTFINARVWQNLEQNYRAGLAAGLTDASD